MRSIRERFIERFILAAPADGVALFGWCVIVLVLLTAVACNPRDDDEPAHQHEPRRGRRP